MKRLHDKLNSRSGASILVALLLFFICCMVAASVLATAVSNAGKVRSSRIEQQKQLLLSSAAELICNRLQTASYIGKYEVCEWKEKTGEDTYTKADGTVGKEPVYQDFFYCRQLNGNYGGGDLDTLLPLGKELDAMFGRQFTGSGYRELPDTEVEQAQITHTLTLSLPDLPDGYLYAADPANPGVYEFPREVTAEVTLGHDMAILPDHNLLNTWHITVAVWLGTGAKPDRGADMMLAELVAENVPALNYIPAGRSPAADLPASPDTPVTIVTKETEPGLKWKLNWIKKGAS